MKIFTSLLSVTLAATLAFSSQAGSLEHRGEAVKVKTLTVLSGQKPTASGMRVASPGKSGLKAAQSVGRLNQRKARVGAPENTTFIEDQPEGTASMWKRSSTGFGVVWESIEIYDDRGLAVTMVEGADGKLWFNAPLSQFPVASWIYGTVADNVITIPGGQCIYREIDEDTEDWVYAYLFPVEFVDDGDGGWYWPTEDTDYRLVYENGEYHSEDPEVMLGLCIWDNEENELFWTGYGDLGMVYAVQEEVALVPPASIETESWALTNGAYGGYFVNVGVEGESIYIQGLYSTMPDAWVKLNLDGDKATMTPGQYLGADPESWHYSYALCGTVEEIWDDYYEEYVDKIFPATELVFKYDADKKVLESDGAMVVSTQPDEVVYVAHVNKPYIAKQIRVPGTPPANPYDIQISPFNEVYGNGYFSFKLPCMDTDGNLVDTKRLYYNVFVDGELFEFYNDEYIRLPEASMTDIPWSYRDSWDFYTEGVYHTVYYFFTGFETLGVQSIYDESESADRTKLLRSDLITVSANGGVSEVATDSKVVKDMRYFDLQGREVANPKEGLYIRSITYSDGTVSNSKVIK